MRSSYLSPPSQAHTGVLVCSLKSPAWLCNAARLTKFKILEHPTTLLGKSFQETKFTSHSPSLSLPHASLYQPHTSLPTHTRSQRRSGPTQIQVFKSAFDVLKCILPHSQATMGQYFSSLQFAHRCAYSKYTNRQRQKSKHFVISES